MKKIEIEKTYECIFVPYNRLFKKLVKIEINQ